VDLAELDAVAALRAEAWESRGATWKVVRWPVRDKSAASLRIEKGTSLGEIILWTSGETDLSWSVNGGPVEVEHHELTSSFGLHGCVDDLEERLHLHG
jgi:hypothetical protein